jgi:hypothetical protein
LAVAGAFLLSFKKSTKQINKEKPSEVTNRNKSKQAIRS